MKVIYVMIWLCMVVSARAQESVFDRLAISAEYRYLGRNVIGLGLECRLTGNEDIAFNVGAKAFYTSVEDKGRLLPQLNIECGRIVTGGISVTPYAIEPQFAINLFNLLRLNTGYAVSIHQERYFRGITFGIQFNLAMRKRSQYYDYFRLGF